MNSINTWYENKPVGEGLSRAVNQNSDGAGFKERLEKVLNDVNQLQLESGEMADKFVRGEIEDVHDVMIAAEKASVSLELTLEVRNKLVEAYREIMRIQM